MHRYMSRPLIEHKAYLHITVRIPGYISKIALAKGYSDICVAEAIKIRIPSCLDGFSSIPLREWYAIPLLERVPVRRSRGIEQPVSSVTNEGFDLLDVQTIAFYPYTKNVPFTSVFFSWFRLAGRRTDGIYQ